MVLDSKKVINALKSKGFVENKTHHLFFEYFINGKFVFHTKVSHGNKHDIDNYLIGQMKKQCNLSKKEFLNLINCPLSKEDYKSIIKNLGLHL